MNAGASIRCYGDRALLVEVADNAAAQVVARRAREAWNAALEEVILGHRTVVLVWHEHPPEAAAVISRLEAAAAGDAPRAGSRRPDAGAVTIQVRYDGPDLEAIAEAVGVTVGTVIERHSAPQYTVAFTGFMPGFPYLVGGDPTLDIPRLATPRAAVPAGTVAVAAGYTGIYPRASPGGWNLLGQTDERLFDLNRNPPSLLTPGTRVRFAPR